MSPFPPHDDDGIACPITVVGSWFPWVLGGSLHTWVLLHWEHASSFYDSQRHKLCQHPVSLPVVQAAP